MKILRVGGSYTRKEIWEHFRPSESFPHGGSWLTGYVVEGTNLLIFANIGTPGRTGHDFPNEYDEDTKEMLWFGKPNAHSAQPIFRALFEDSLKPIVFARWDQKNTSFTYLGKPTIRDYRDGISVDVKGGIQTIRISFSFYNANSRSSELPPEGVIIEGTEGRSYSVVVNKYERNPRLRAECIKIYGARCQVCGFDFEKAYGDLGKGYCHVHHLQPLSEIKSEHEVNPKTDLLPVCPNCHAMIHAKSPAISPSEIKKLIEASRLST